MCRQTLTNPRRTPSLSRTTTIGICPAKHVKKSPGFATRSARPAYCQERAKMRSPSSRWIAGSAYQSAGRRAPAARAAPRSVSILKFYAVRSAAISSKAATKASQSSKEWTTDNVHSSSRPGVMNTAVHVVEPGEVGELAVLAL